MVGNVQGKSGSNEAYNECRERILKLQIKSDSISILLKKIEKNRSDKAINSVGNKFAKLSLKITGDAARLLSLTKEECYQASTVELIEKLRKEKSNNDALACEILSKIIPLTDNLLQLSTGK